MCSVGKLGLSAAPLLVLFLAGCGKSNIVKVNGILTYKKVPVTNAYIEFRPEHGRQSWAETDENGRFKINYDAHQDGAVVGKHQVWVKPRPVTRAEKEAAIIHGVGSSPRSKELEIFFDKYGPDKSTLTVEITHDTTELTFHLD